MKLYAISDLHVGHAVNRDALQAFPARPDDWLILGGDMGETCEHLELVLQLLTPRFKQLLWVPGNHELWTSPKEPSLRGETKYRALVALCRRYGALTPEDPYPIWDGEGGPAILAPLFLLYDYSFRPAHVQAADAVRWAADSGVLCADEHLLHPDPWPSREAWCQARLAHTEARLAEVAGTAPLVLINHFPMRQELVRLRFIPRFRIWCGTTRTEDWHRRFGAKVVVSGHLHVPATDWIDGVRFEEVSLGYPKQWQRRRFGLEGHIREILPGRSSPPRAFGWPIFHW